LTHFTFVRAACAAAILGLIASPAAAQGRGRAASQDRGFELGVDAELAYTKTHIDGPQSQPPGTTSFSLPNGDVRVGFPTSGPVTFEIAGNLNHLSSNGESFTSSLVELGLPIALNETRTAAEWFVRPAIGWQHTGQSNGPSTNRATLAAGIGVRVPVSNHISMRFELRDTYATKHQGISANTIGLLGGVSVYTR
jgi:opacity protein-like surface antigen